MSKARCFNCDMDVSYEIKEEKIDIFKGARVNVIEQIAYCKACGAEVPENYIEIENQRRLNEKYRQIKNFPEAYEHTEFRKKLYLSEGEMGKLIGIDRVWYIELEHNGCPSDKSGTTLNLFLGSTKEREKIATERITSGKIGRRTYEKVLNKPSNFFKIKDFEDELETYNMVKKEYIQKKDGSPEPGDRHGFIFFEFTKVENLIGFLCSKRTLNLDELGALLWIIDYSRYKASTVGITGLPYNIYNKVPAVDMSIWKNLISCKSDIYRINSNDNDMSISAVNGYSLTDFSNKEMSIINRVADLLYKEIDIISLVTGLFSDTESSSYSLKYTDVSNLEITKLFS